MAPFSVGLYYVLQLPCGRHALAEEAGLLRVVGLGDVLAWSVGSRST
jgi:hypothetical protein